MLRGVAISITRKFTQPTNEGTYMRRGLLLNCVIGVLLTNGGAARERDEQRNANAKLGQ